MPNNTPFKLPSILCEISAKLSSHNARAIVVGGAVRDHFLGIGQKDFDIEVYDIESIGLLESVLARFGSVNLVGKSFGILKLHYHHCEYDFSLPRTEKKVGLGHKGFDVIADSRLNFKEAAKRRDFTINAIGYDIDRRKFLDPFDGLGDMKSKILRHIDADTFVEDPLRVYRAVQFCARFGYELDSQTHELCSKMVQNDHLDELPHERIYIEWQKLLLKSTKPSKGFELMQSLGMLRYFPELQALIDTPQSPQYHPEGDVWVHTLMALDAMVPLLGDNTKQNLKFLFAILCHDLGKPSTTTIEKDGTIRSIGHEKAGIEPTQTFLRRLTNEESFIESILPLVEHHLKPSQFYSASSSAKAIRRLSTQVNIAELIMVAKADFLGRTTDEAKLGIYKAGEWLLAKAKELDVHLSPPPRLLEGRDLIALGMTPSPEFGKILTEIYSLQLDGELTTHQEAVEYVKRVWV